MFNRNSVGSGEDMFMCENDMDVREVTGKVLHIKYRVNCLCIFRIRRRHINVSIFVRPSVRQHVTGPKLSSSVKFDILDLHYILSIHIWLLYT